MVASTRSSRAPFAGDDRVAPRRLGDTGGAIGARHTAAAHATPPASSAARSYRTIGAARAGVTPTRYKTTHAARAMPRWSCPRSPPSAAAAMPRRAAAALRTAAPCPSKSSSRPAVPSPTATRPSSSASPRASPAAPPSPSSIPTPATTRSRAHRAAYALTLAAERDPTHARVARAHADGHPRSGALPRRRARLARPHRRPLRRHRTRAPGGDDARPAKTPSPPSSTGARRRRRIRPSAAPSSRRRCTR